MSHLTVIKSTFKDLGALQVAAATLGHPLTEGGRARYYSGVSDNCDWLMKLPGKYDVGFKANAQAGCYEVVADSEVLSKGSYLAREAHAILGPELKFLHQEYTAAVLARDCAMAGRSVVREKLPDGRLQLTVTGY